MTTVATRINTGLSLLGFAFLVGCLDVGAPLFECSSELVTIKENKIVPVQAELWKKDCGATTASSTILRVVPIDVDWSLKSNKYVVASFEGDPNLVSIFWSGQNLTVDSDGIEFFRKEDAVTVRGYKVIVVYQ